MFERFNEPAREVVVLAQDEARGLKHNYIGTEHLLLGLLRSDGLAARALASLGIALDEARDRVSRIVGSGDEVKTGHIPFTPRSKKVLELGLREARALGHNYIGPEHILLGLVRENQGVASRILLDLGADADTVRRAVHERLPGREPNEHAEKEAAIARMSFEEAAQLHGRELELGRTRTRLRPSLPLGIPRRAPSVAAVAAAAGAFVLGLLVGRLIWGEAAVLARL